MNKINENRPGYKKTKAGCIPNDWECFQFHHLAALSNKKFLPGSSEIQRCIELEHIDKETGHLNGTTISSEQLSQKNVFSKNNILFGKLRPNLRKYYLANFEGVCSSEIWVLKNKSTVCAEYLYRVVQSERFIQAASKTCGSKMPRADWDYVVDCYHAIPKEQSEQKRISAILSTWDGAIQTHEKLIVAKKEIKKALMQKLLNPVRRSAWQKIRLGNLFKERNEGNQPYLLLLAVTRERGIIPADETGRKDSSAEDKSKYKRVTPGDIAYNTMRMWQGVSALSRLEGIVSPAYTVCIPKKNLIDGNFAAHFFKHPPIINLFHRYSQGLVSDTLNLKFHHFAEITVQIPPIEEQRKIAAVLDQLDREIESLITLNEKYSQQKRGLMQKLLTGAIRVKNEHD